MLAVFNQTVAKVPVGLKSPEAAGGEGGRRVVDHFAAERKGAVVVDLGLAGTLAYTSENQNPLLPRLFAVADDIFCMFQGHLENLTSLKQQYGLGKIANEVIIVIEAYKTLRDRGPFPASQVLRDLSGKFAFVLFDSSSNSAFIAGDAHESVPFFWGADAEDHLIVSDDIGIIKKGCGKSFALSLKSFEHPLNELKPVPRVDSDGNFCGSDYKVDDKAKKESGIPRVGSAADWSSQF